MGWRAAFTLVHPYTCLMERLADKCLVFLACLALVVLAGEASAAIVVAVAVAVCASAAFELSYTCASAVAAGLCCAACVAAALVPGAWVTLPLVAYDLPRIRWRWTWVVGLCVAACPWVAGALPVSRATVLLAFVGCSMALSWRCGREVGLSQGLHRLEDDLSDKVLSLSKKNRELEDAREHETHAAALAERTRIAREIHDSVGHLLTRLVLEVEALKVVHRDDSQATEELGELASGLGEAMSSMRQSMHALDDSSVDLGVELNRLARESGIADVTVSCDTDALPPAEVSRCLVAVTREALTNAARHAHATHASVKATGMPGIWQLKVVNDGSVPREASGLEECGMGIRGMRERVEGRGGTLTVATDGQRFSVFASIPRGR